MRLAMRFPGRAACLAALVMASSLQAASNKTPKKPAKSVPSHRTTVPEVTPARWTQPLPALPRRADPKRDDYLAFIKRIYNRVGPSFRERAGEANMKNQHIYARWEAFFLRVTKDPEYARWALKFIAGDCDYFTTGAGAERKVTFSTLIDVTRACSWLLDSEALAPGDRELCRRWMRLMEERLEHWEYGAMNRSFGSALEQAAFAQWWPDDPVNGKRKAYADEVWNDWWPYRDTFENSMSYNSLSIYTLMVWLEITDQEAIYYDPGFKAFLDRHADLATPLGVMPFQGDNPGWQSHPTYWIAIMEKMASAYRDGRCKWIAQRMFEYVQAHEADIRQWNRKDEVVMARLMEAYLWADDSVKPEPPTTGCVMTRRKMARFATLEELAESGMRRHSVLLHKPIPDKLVFRTGWDAGAAFAMIEANPILSHGHCDVGAVSCYMAEGSLLLTSTT